MLLEHHLGILYSKVFTREKPGRLDNRWKTQHWLQNYVHISVHQMCISQNRVSQKNTKKGFACMAVSCKQTRGYRLDIMVRATTSKNCKRNVTFFCIQRMPFGLCMPFGHPKHHHTPFTAFLETIWHLTPVRDTLFQKRHKIQTGGDRWNRSALAGVYIKLPAAAFWVRFPRRAQPQWKQPGPSVWPGVGGTGNHGETNPSS